MKKRHRKATAAGQVGRDEILPEYDFSRAQPNKYAARYAALGRAPKPNLGRQESDPLDAEAIFTLGFRDEKARQAFITEMG